jgi:hypothetical protein
MRAPAVALLAVALACCSKSSKTTPGEGGHGEGGEAASSSTSGDASSTSSGASGTGGAEGAGGSRASSGSSAASSSGSTSSSSGAGGASPVGLGYMVGVKCGLTTICPGKVEAWLGRPVDVAGATINTNAWIASGAFTQTSGGNPLLEVSFPLLSIFGENNGLDDMAKAASGAYDDTYTAMAKALASSPNPLLSVRIGWEFNGNWYAWSNGVGTNATYANYVAAFKRAAAIVKKYNPNALVQWCIAWGQPASGSPSTWESTVMEYWPGKYDASTNPGGVDVVSMDFYQANISMYYNGGKPSTWAMAESDTSFTTINLDWMVTFAQQQGVKVALSEYAAGSPKSGGAGTGAGLDDGTWTAASIAWMNGLPSGLFLWANWSDDAPADDIETAGANPAEQAAWKTAWSNTRFTGTWWKGPAPY